MKRLEMYQCEGCGAVGSAEDVMKCEASHVNIVGIKRVKYHRKSRYPDFIVVETADGYFLEYEFKANQGKGE